MVNFSIVKLVLSLSLLFSLLIMSGFRTLFPSFFDLYDNRTIIILVASKKLSSYLFLSNSILVIFVEQKEGKKREKEVNTYLKCAEGICACC